MTYLSNVNLRAVLAVLVRRAGGELHISNEDLYDAMMPVEGTAEPFVVDETSTGIRISVKEPQDLSEPDDALQSSPPADQMPPH